MAQREIPISQPSIANHWLGSKQVTQRAQVGKSEDVGQVVVQRGSCRAVGHVGKTFELGIRQLVEQASKARHLIVGELAMDFSNLTSSTWTSENTLDSTFSRTDCVP